MEASRATIAIIVDGAGGTSPRQITVDALEASIAASGAAVDVEVCNTSTLRQRRADAYAGMLVGPGSPYDDPAAVDDWIRTAREQGIPLVGT